MGAFLKKVFLVFLVLFLVMVVAPLAAGVGVVALAYSTGTVMVDVDDGHGTDFTVPLPAGLIPMGLRFLPDEVCQELEREVHPSWGAVRNAVEEIDRIPDAVLVDVESGDDHVRVLKKRGQIVIRVWSEDGHVNVAVPVRLVSQVTNQVERACF